jgi:hypothetical protein
MSFEAHALNQDFQKYIAIFSQLSCVQEVLHACILPVLSTWDCADKLCLRELDCSCDSADLCPSALSFEAEGLWKQV